MLGEKIDGENPSLVEKLGFSLKCHLILKNLYNIFLYLPVTTYHLKL